MDIAQVRKIHDDILVLTFPSLYVPPMTPEHVGHGLRVCGVVGELPSDLVINSKPSSSLDAAIVPLESSLDYSYLWGAKFALTVSLARPSSFREVNLSAAR